MSKIELKHIDKFYGKNHVLKDLNLTIEDGDFMTLLGPSGCGKTTLMRQLAGFSEPEEGDVLVDGKRMNGLPPFKRNTPLVFQEYALFPHMTVYENISYGLKLKKAPKEEKKPVHKREVYIPENKRTERPPRKEYVSGDGRRPQQGGFGGRPAGKPQGGGFKAPPIVPAAPAKSWPRLSPATRARSTTWH